MDCCPGDSAWALDGRAQTISPDISLNCTVQRHVSKMVGSRGFGFARVRRVCAGLPFAGSARARRFPPGILAKECPAQAEVRPLRCSSSAAAFHSPCKVLPFLKGALPQQPAFMSSPLSPGAPGLAGANLRDRISGCRHSPQFKPSS